MKAHAMNRVMLTCVMVAVSCWGMIAGAEEKTPHAEVVAFYGYDDCVRLQNGIARVILCPAAGGRVLEYSRKGVNALYLAPGGEGWDYARDKTGGSMSAGRFDIGPEPTIASHPHLWMGRWTAEITGPRSARLVSIEDAATGVQLIRDFELDAESTELKCTQTIRNISQAAVEYCHWSRTFAIGGGKCVIPLTNPSRFPNGYVMYGPGPVINFRPEDPQIRRRDGFLEITGVPAFPKLGMDSAAGWFAYLMPNDLMFVKRFKVDTDRVYNEVAGLTMSVWYPDGPMCELEPIGPRERLLPGQYAAFTETWYLLPRQFPKGEHEIDLSSVARQVGDQTR